VVPEVTKVTQATVDMDAIKRVWREYRYGYYYAELVRCTKAAENMKEFAYRDDWNTYTTPGDYELWDKRVQALRACVSGVDAKSIQMHPSLWGKQCITAMADFYTGKAAYYTHWASRTSN
jgi:hypothetical protein